MKWLCYYQFPTIKGQHSPFSETLRHRTPGRAENREVGNEKLSWGKHRCAGLLGVDTVGGAHTVGGHTQ